MPPSAQSGLDGGAARPASTAGGASHVSPNGAERPGSPDSADGSIRQPAPPAPFETLADLK
eukprot:6623204-Pyramimonas_sp.AAC.1